MTRASIRQVAAKANVSPMTVSRVLNGRKSEVSVATYDRVMKAISDLEYVPVHSSVQNRHIETKAIGLVPSHLMVLRYTLDALTYEGICERASTEGYDLLVMLRKEAEWFANRHEIRFLDRRSDGFIFISPNMGEWDEVLEILVKHDIPSVVCYRRDVPKGVAWVDADNASLVRLAVANLRAHGHERIAYLCGPEGIDEDPQVLTDMLSWRVAFDDAMRQKAFAEMVGAEDLVVRGCVPYWNAKCTAVDRLLELGVTGVLCVNDIIAGRLFDEISERGLSVPSDFSVIGIDNLPVADTIGLTTVDLGYDKVGFQAVEAWVALKSGKAADECCREVEGVLVERESVGRPRRL